MCKWTGTTKTSDHSFSTSQPLTLLTVNQTIRYHLRANENLVTLPHKTVPSSLTQLRLRVKLKARSLHWTRTAPNAIKCTWVL